MASKFDQRLREIAHTMRTTGEAMMASVERAAITQGVGIKRCTKCGEDKPATSEFFAKCVRSRDGLQCHCKVCNKAYAVANKEQVNAKARKWWANNKERYNGGKRRPSRRLPYSDADRERNRRWHAANRDRINERVGAWRQANPERALAISRCRKARKRNAEGTHTAADVQAQYARQKGKCYWCNEKVGDTYHVDHVVPLSRGGSNWPENLVIACPTCNLSKNNKLPHEWAQGGRLI